MTRQLLRIYLHITASTRQHQTSTVLRHVLATRIQSPILFPRRMSRPLRRLHSVPALSSRPLFFFCAFLSFPFFCTALLPVPAHAHSLPLWPSPIRTLADHLHSVASLRAYFKRLTCGVSVPLSPIIHLTSPRASPLRSWTTRMRMGTKPARPKFPPPSASQNLPNTKPFNHRASPFQPKMRQCKPKPAEASQTRPCRILGRAAVASNPRALSKFRLAPAEAGLWALGYCPPPCPVFI